MTLGVPEEGTQLGLEGRGGSFFQVQERIHSAVYSFWPPPTGPTRRGGSLDPTSGQAPALVSLFRCSGPQPKSDRYSLPSPQVVAAGTLLVPPGPPGALSPSISAWVAVEGQLAPEDLHAQGPPPHTQPWCWLSPAVFQQLLWPWCHIPSKVPCGCRGHAYHQCRTWRRPGGCMRRAKRQACS